MAYRRYNTSYDDPSGSIAAERREQERIADLDYAKAYENVHSIGGEAHKFLKNPKKLTIFQMYFRLNSVSITDLLADKLAGVEELVIIADVVAIDGNEEITLPGIHRVVILCRLLVGWKQGEPLTDTFATYIVIRLSLQQNKDIKEGLYIGDGAFRAPQWAPGKPTQMFVYARGVRFAMPGGEICMDLYQKTLVFSQHIVNLDNRSYKPPDYYERPVESETWNMRIQSLQVASFFGTEIVGSLEMYPDPFQGDSRFMNYKLAYNVRHLLKEPSLGFITNGTQTVPSHLLEDANVVMGIQVTLLSAESILLYGQKAAGEVAVEGAIEYCKWLTTHVLGNRGLVKKGLTDGKDQALPAELQTLYVRAQALVTTYGGGNPNMLIPPLSHQLYSEMIKNVIDATKLYDAELKNTVSQIRTLQTTETAVGEVARAIGGTLMGHFQVLAARERDMENHIGKVEEQQKKDLIEAERKLKKLQDNMIAYKDAMTKAKGDIEAQSADHAKKQKAKAALSILGSIFAVVGAIVTFGATLGSAAKALADLPDQLEKLVDVLEKLEKVMDAVKAFDELLNSSPGQNVKVPVMPEGPSDSDWEIFVNKVEAVVDTIPQEIEAAKLWKTECRNVAAVGRDISTVVAQITKLKFELKVQGWQKEMAIKQRDRLQAIKQTQPADLDSSSILQDMVVQLDMGTQRMIISLVETLNIQNAALYYNFLQKPEALSMGAPTIHNVQQLLIDKERRYTEGMAKIGKSTKQKKVYELKDIPVQILRSGKDFYFNIPVDDYHTFPRFWQRVRIQHVEIRFTGDNKPTTANGEVHFQLRGDRVFHDRYKGETFRYEAVTPIKYKFSYDLSTGEPTWENKDTWESRGNFMQMTPFSHWKLRVPLSTETDPNENEDIHFPVESGKTSVAITFQLTVLR